MSFPRYETFHDSGVKRLGALPTSWSVVELKRLAKLVYGDALATDVRNDSGEVKVYGSNGPIGVHDTSNTVSPVIFVGRKGSCGALNWSDSPGFAIDTVYFIDHRSCRVDLRWLFWTLHVLGLETASQDTGVPGLARELAHEARVPWPSPNEQTAIAAFLDSETAKIDALVEAQRRLIELLKEKRQAVISHAVTKGLDPTVPMKDSGVEWLGEVPAHWSTLPLRAVASGPNSIFIDGDWIESKDISAEGIRYLTTGNVGEGLYKEQGAGFITDETFRALNCTEVYPGDILISRLNLPIGRACMVPELGRRIVTSVDNVIVRAGPDVVRRYLVHLLTAKSFFAHMETLARGTTMQRVSRTILGAVRICLPPTAEQIVIADYIDRQVSGLDQLSLAAHATVQLLNERRAALISAAVTGKIDVRGLVPAAKAEAA